MMKAEGYAQIVPVWDRRNYVAPTVTSLRLVKVTQTLPREPEPGALILKLSFDIPTEVFEPSTLHLSIEGSPEEIASAVVPIPVEEDDAE